MANSIIKKGITKGEVVVSLAGLSCAKLDSAGYYDSVQVSGIPSNAIITNVVYVGSYRGGLGVFASNDKLYLTASKAVTSFPSNDKVQITYITLGG